jgi:hypothetical protein
LKTQEPGTAELADTADTTEPLLVEPSTAAEPTGPNRSWLRLLLPVAIFAMSRLGVLIAARGAGWLEPKLRVSRVLSGWDGGWFIRVARDGYPESLDFAGSGNPWAFWPGWPGLIRGVQAVTGLAYDTVAIVTATALGFVAVVAIWLLVEGRMGQRAALTTTLLVCFFPTAYVFGMAYSESMFFAVVALGLLAVDREKWLAAGVLASIACLVRVPGAALVAAVVIAALLAARRDRSWRPLVGVVVAPLGLVAWTVYQWVRLGTPMAYFKAQETGWRNEFVWFTTPFKSLGRILTSREAWQVPTDLMAGMALVLVVVSVIAAVLMARRNPGVVPVSWWVYSGFTVVFAFSPYWPTGVLRYSMAAFPLFAAAWGRLPRQLVGPIVGLSATIMGTLALVAFVGLRDFRYAPFAP